MIRRIADPRPAVQEPVPIEYESIPIRVVQIAVDGVAQPLLFQLEATHTMDKTDSEITIVQGERRTEIPRSRILVIEEQPGTLKRKRDVITL